jgi:hypothetical protein
MGIGVDIFGYIRCPGYGWQKEDQRIFRHNRRVIAHLPLTDDEWPYVTRRMFSMLPLWTEMNKSVPQYQDQLIHFAASYKNMYSIEDEWFIKFEKTLAQLCWLDAVVINGFSNDEYRWKAESTTYLGQYTRQPPVPPSRWTFEHNHLERRKVTVQQYPRYCPFISSFHLPQPSAQQNEDGSA